MSQDDPKHEEHLHEDQDEVGGTDRPRFEEQQDSEGTGDPGEPSGPAGKPEGEDDDEG